MNRVQLADALRDISGYFGDFALALDDNNAGDGLSSSRKLALALAALPPDVRETLGEHLRNVRSGGPKYDWYLN